MRTNLRVGLVVVAVSLIAWQGILLSVPHQHADQAVPQEELGCSVSRPLSHENHLHSAGAVLTPHSCMACLFAHHGVVEMTVVSGVEVAPPGYCASPVALDCRSQIHSRLPLLRGPPLGV